MLAEWLTLLESRHPKIIDMGLERVEKVKKNLQLKFSCPVIMVAGTNGKGSTCATMESILLHAGYKVGMYTSPHFISFNERARMNGRSVSNDMLVSSFEVIEGKRDNISLTYFEFTTLSIMYLLAKLKPDVAILEVGLGGRLDAVNVIDADISIVTSIDIDHVEYLGDTREKIGLEKAGIFRSGKAAICSDPEPPESLIKHANKINADLRLLGRDFSFTGNKQQWNYQGKDQHRHSLNYPVLRGANQLLNASAALAALEILKYQVPVSAQEVRSGLATVNLPGRFQILPGEPLVILDVAHNPHAVATLAINLDSMGFYPYTYAIFGTMIDKSIDVMLKKLSTQIDHWCFTDLPLARAAKSEDLQRYLLDGNFRSGDLKYSTSTFNSPEAAYESVLAKAGVNDRIIVFGSFLTVAGVMAYREPQSP